MNEDHGTVYVYVPVEAQEVSLFSSRALGSDGGQIGGEYILQWTRANGFTDWSWEVDPPAARPGMPDRYPPVDFKPANLDNMTVEEINAHIGNMLSGMNALYSNEVILWGCGVHA